MKWSKKTPTEEGWYWIKYRGKRGTTMCPCQVTIFKSGLSGTAVRTAWNDWFMEGPNHGGLGLKEGGGKLDKTIRFGPKIPEPE